MFSPPLRSSHSLAPYSQGSSRSSTPPHGKFIEGSTDLYSSNLARNCSDSSDLYSNFTRNLSDSIDLYSNIARSNLSDSSTPPASKLDSTDTYSKPPDSVNRPFGMLNSDSADAYSNISKPSSSASRPFGMLTSDSADNYSSISTSKDDQTDNFTSLFSADPYGSNSGYFSNVASSDSNSKDNLSDSDFISKAYATELLENGLKEERFRIDRKKLEDMLQVHNNVHTDVENAEVFFEKVMVETSTQISWPSKLKIGAKSKKDPHVKIVGKPEAVQMAKEKILEILDTKKNRVTLKMDVSHSDHSYTIGKGGFKIQQVMEETGCHIHFPDSNRNSAAEKSNQVSIAGQAAGAELARTKIRDLLPLVFTFELPNGEHIHPGEECSPAVQHIQQTYSFNVTFRPLPPTGRTLLVVRGCQRLLSRLRQGLALLMEYLTGSKTIPVMGYMKTEIAAQHHQFVQGNCNVNTQMIMSKTGATILFPEPGPSTFGGMDSPPVQQTQIPLIAGHSTLRTKSTVIIQGSFDSVCLAWQELLKCLPLVLMFDLKEGQELDPVIVNKLMETFNINIMVRPKMKENTKSVLIRGAEKDSRILFQVRKDILGLEEEDSFPSSSSPGFKSFRTVETFTRTAPPAQEMRDAKKPSISTAESLSLLSTLIQQNPQIMGILNNLSTLPAPGLDMAHQIPNPLYRNMGMIHNPQPNTLPFNHVAVKNVEHWINRPDRSYAFSSGVHVANFLQKDKQLPGDDGDSGIFIPSNRGFNGFETVSDKGGSHPQSSASSTSSNDNTPDRNTSRYLRREHQTKDPDNADVHQLLADYGNKKLTASKAMQQPIDGVRTPNRIWSGYGFSKSMPDFAGQSKRSATNNSGSISEYLESESATGSNPEVAAAKAWNTDVPEKSDSPLEQVPSPFAQSNFWENVPRLPPVNYGSIKNLEQLLSLLDLEKYKEVFAYHEIDLSIYLSLTENDLKQLNISYGARRKMLTAISAIREQRMGDWSKTFRAAPGAERRSLYTRYSASDESADRA